LVNRTKNIAVAFYTRGPIVQAIFFEFRGKLQISAMNHLKIQNYKLWKSVQTAR